MQQTANNPPPVTAASITAVQQVQSSIKFDVPVFEGDSTVSSLAWNQRVVYQAKACDFGAELTAAGGGGLSVGADAFNRSNVDSVRLRNTHTAWMTLINNCR